MSRLGVVLLAFGSLLTFATFAAARPVRVGVYTELTRGVRIEHPCPSYRCDSHGTGRVRAEAPSVTTQAFRIPLMRESRRTGACLLSLSEGRIVAGDGQGLAFLRSDGSVTSRTAVGLLRETPALSPNDELALSTQTGDVAIVDLRGRVRARRHEDASPYSAPLMLADGTVVWSTGPRVMVALSSVDLSDVFRRSVVALGRVAPVTLDEDTFVVLSAGSGVLVHATGELGATFASRALFRAPISVARDGTVWGPADDGALIYVNPRTLRGGGASATLHISDAPLIADDGSMRLLGVHELVATDTRGNPLWTFTDAARRVVSGSVDQTGTTLLMLEDAAHTGRLVAVSPEGAEIWAIAFADQPTACAPVVSDTGVVAVLANDAEVRDATVVLGFH